MDENDILETRPADKLFRIITAQSVTVILLILMLTAVKYFFGGCYAEVREWYEEHICAETDANEVLETAGGDFDEV